MAIDTKDNLIPFSERTKEEARILGAKGGRASGETRRRKRTLKEELLLILEQGDNQKKVSTALIDKCFSGDVSAIKELAILINERTEKVTNENVNMPLEEYLSKTEAEDDY